MTTADWIALGLMLLGSGFFVAGTVGLLRFPDLHSRLHALTKADNLGLGLVIAGLIAHAGSLAVAAKLIATWVLALAASSTSAYLIAKQAVEGDVPPTESELP